MRASVNVRDAEAVSASCSVGGRNPRQVVDTARRGLLRNRGEPRLRHARGRDYSRARCTADGVGRAGGHGGTRAWGSAGDRGVPAAGQARFGRYGTGLPRPVGAGPHGRRETGPRGAGGARGVPGPLPAGGGGRAAGRRVLDGAGPGRGHRGGGAVGGHRIRGRPQPAARRRARARRAARAVGADPRGRAGARAQGHPRGRDRAPGPEAVERAGHHRRAARDRLRHRPRAGDHRRGRRAPHRDRLTGRLARVHGARAGARGPGHPGLRRVLAGLGAGLRGDRADAVRERGRRHPRADVPHRPGGAGPGGRAGGDRRPGPWLSAQGPGGPALPGRAAGPHGRAGHGARRPLPRPLAAGVPGGPAGAARGGAAGGRGAGGGQDGGRGRRGGLPVRWRGRAGRVAGARRRL
ncbi:conserved hypothetical protein [Streptomyces misionensis JCM 4497]